MKVLFLSCQLEFGQSGSAYAFRMDKLRRGLERHGIETDFLSLRERPFHRPVLAHALKSPTLRARLNQYDFIHAGGHATYAAALVRPFITARVIYDVHGDIVSEAELEWEARPRIKSAFELVQAKLVDAISFQRSDFFLVVSRPSARRISRRRIPADRIALVRNGVDLEMFRPRSSTPSSEFTVGYAGGFQRWQGIDNLIGAFDLLRDQPIRLEIIGFSQDHADLRRSIDGRLGNHVELVGRLPQASLVERLASVQVLALPRPRHPAVEVAMPTKFGEYLALGKPVMVCDVDETAVLVRDNGCGFVSQPGPAALAETIRQASSSSEALLNQNGKNARALAEREFSWDQIARGYADTLHGWAAA